MKLEALDCGPGEWICMSLPAAATSPVSGSPLSPPSLGSQGKLSGVSLSTEQLYSYSEAKCQSPCSTSSLQSPWIRVIPSFLICAMSASQPTGSGAMRTVIQLSFSHGSSSTLRSWFLSRGIQATGSRSYALWALWWRKLGGNHCGSIT